MSSSLDKATAWPGIALAVALMVGAAALPARAEAVSAPEAIAFLNQQRAANGLPADLTESAALTDGCTKHNHYMALNGMGHGEDPARPGYTPEGAGQGEAGGAENLHHQSMERWSASQNPWGYFDRGDGTWGGATLHVYPMFRPENLGAGYAASEGFLCMRFRRGRAAPAAPQFFAYTADGGRANVPYAVQVAEWPYTPRDIAGLPSDRATGPDILLFSHGFIGWGDRAEVVTASLTGPSGPVEIRTVEEATQRGEYSGKWFRGGGVMIPVAPLSPSSHYEGRVTWRAAASGTNAVQTFAFETAPYLPPRSYPEWPTDATEDPAAGADAPTCRRVLHRVRYRQRYRTASGRIRYRWRTKAHLHRHRHRYRDSRGRRRVRTHWHRHYLRRCT